MAKEAPKAEPAAEAAAPAKKKLPVKTVAIIMVMLIGEAALIIGLMTMMGKPSDVKAVELEGDHGHELDVLQEIPVLEEKYTNNTSGRLFVYDVEIIMQAKAKFGDDLSTELESRRAEVRTGVGAIVASAQQSYFNEPSRATLTRQVLEYLRTVFPADEQGEERVHAVLIPKCIGFAMDG